MKRLRFLITICTFIIPLAGCEKAQQAIDAVDNAKTFSENLQKNASKKLQEALPKFAQKSGDNEEKESGDREKQEKDD